MKPEEIYILIGCEESQAICLAFRSLGFQAYSCDLKPCSGGHPEWHIQGDVLTAITGGWITLQNGDRFYINRWNGVMLHPVCRYMAVSGLFRNIGNPERAEQTEKALQFVCDMLNLCLQMRIPNIGIENTVSCISTRIYKDITGLYKVWSLSLKHVKYHKFFKATQTIQPYEFYEDASKRTCLWLIGWPKLIKGKRFPGRWVDGVERWSNQTDSGQNRLTPSADRDEKRSKTYPGIAKAIAEQWGQHLLKTKLF